MDGSRQAVCENLVSDLSVGPLCGARDKAENCVNALQNGCGLSFASPNIITAPVTQVDFSTHTMLSKVGGIAGAAQV
ncbi:hypothetical protein CupriaWKF_30905 [Cupriavidus sp. WKF15]|uniref:hypothetical protein n=1 Tax=Cupriavidus sp. WKF15 TaxID=3032282 RepID=UPI0023E0F29E|nr:hypothetical protein [Cupriavidus sp. WKF15]WER50765.1 hypothetical protein CupriaWKF_30905 [Cupriavidus sp. WKF15]